MALQKAEGLGGCQKNGKALAKDKGTLWVAHPDRFRGLAGGLILGAGGKRRWLPVSSRLGDLGRLSLWSGVVNAIAGLEDGLHPGPFACVLGNKLFEEAHRPEQNFHGAACR